MTLRIVLFLSLPLLNSCSASGTHPYGESYDAEPPALPIDPHPAQPGSFTNRTEHTQLSD